ncbi:MAG: patatin-like phospholipase family protein [Candidatus Izimaplasma sp.]|nr:patatin-like phospholipase family protein [Candidatus Izimaplasma bacterium]
MKKLGIALAGGGARGVYQIGAWKALKEANIFDKIEVFSGASIGSLNAVLFALGDYEKAYNLWMDSEQNAIFKVQNNLIERLKKEKLEFLSKGVYQINKLETYIEESIPFEKLHDKEVYIATTHLGDKDSSFFDFFKTNYQHFFKSNNQIKYTLFSDLNRENKVKTLLASCAIPILFKPVTVDGETYYDGGLLDNTPYQPLVKAGCDTIIVIDLYRFSMMRLKKEKTVDMVVCYPSKGLRGILDFSNKQLKRRFDLGYKDMKKLIEKNKSKFE